jgi:hypothetical protein
LLQSPLIGLQAIGSQTQAPVENPPAICWSSSSFRRRAPTLLSTRFVSIECSFLIYQKVIISGDKPGEERRNTQNPEINPIMNQSFQRARGTWRSLHLAYVEAGVQFFILNAQNVTRARANKGCEFSQTKYKAWTI